MENKSSADKIRLQDIFRSIGTGYGRELEPGDDVYLSLLEKAKEKEVPERTIQSMFLVDQNGTWRLEEGYLAQLLDESEEGVIFDTGKRFSEDIWIKELLSDKEPTENWQIQCYHYRDAFYAVTEQGQTTALYVRDPNLKLLCREQGLLAKDIKDAILIYETTKEALAEERGVPLDAESFEVWKEAAALQAAELDVEKRAGRPSVWMEALQQDIEEGENPEDFPGYRTEYIRQWDRANIRYDFQSKTALLQESQVEDQTGGLLYELTFVEDTEAMDDVARLSYLEKLKERLEGEDSPVHFYGTRLEPGNLAVFYDNVVDYQVFKLTGEGDFEKLPLKLDFSMLDKIRMGLDINKEKENYENMLFYAQTFRFSRLQAALEESKRYKEISNAYSKEFDQSQVRAIRQGVHRDVLVRLSQQLHQFAEDVSNMDMEEEADSVLATEVQSSVRNLKKGKAQLYEEFVQSCIADFDCPPMLQVKAREIRAQLEACKTVLAAGPILRTAVEGTMDKSEGYFALEEVKGESIHAYRVVYLNEYGEIQPLDSCIFPSQMEAVAYACERGNDLIPYVDLKAQRERFGQTVSEQEQRSWYQKELKRFQEEMNRYGYTLEEHHGTRTRWGHERLYAGENAVEYKTIRDFDHLEQFLNQLSEKGQDPKEEETPRAEKEGFEETQENRQQEKSPHGEERSSTMTEAAQEKQVGKEDSEKTLWKEKLEQGIGNMMDSQEFASWCRTQGHLFSNHYSLRNALMVYLQSKEATYTCGYESWKEFGRQVKQGAKGIRIFTPRFAFEVGPKGSLAASIKRTCQAQLKKDPSLKYGTYQLGQSNVIFRMSKNNLFDILMGEKTIASHITSEQLRTFINQNILNKIPIGYGVTTVFDVADVTDQVEYLWVHPKKCTEKEMVLDERENPIKNARGQVKIRNSEERRNRFNYDLNWEISPQDTKKVQILYDVLQSIVRNSGIPLKEVTKEKDKVIASGAFGYFHLPDEKNPKGFIHLSASASPIDKASCLLHEMTHARLHSDTKVAAQSMGKERLSTEEEEMQAEAVAYMTGSTFGLETDHNSFAYLANWSGGRALKSLEESMNIIYKESQALIEEIRSELEARGLSMTMEPVDREPLSQKEKKNMVMRMKQFYLETIERNQTLQSAEIEKYRSLTAKDKAMKAPVEELLTLTYKMDEKITGLNQKIGEFENAATREVENKLYTKIQASMKQIDELGVQLEALSMEEDLTAPGEVLVKPEDIQKCYRENAQQVLTYMKEQGVKQLAGLPDSDLKYLAVSGYINQNYVQYLGVDEERFLKLCVSQLERYKEVLSKNKTVVEIIRSEVPQLPAGTLAHPKEINRILKEEEKRIRELKQAAKKEGGYSPYERCELTVYSFPRMGKKTSGDEMISMETQVDVGDGEQTDLYHHLEQLCDKGLKKEILDKFNKSIKERGETKIRLPGPEALPERIQEGIGEAFKPMKDWILEIQKRKELQREENQERGKKVTLVMS